MLKGDKKIALTTKTINSLIKDGNKNIYKTLKFADKSNKSETDTIANSTCP